MPQPVLRVYVHRLGGLVAEWKAALSEATAYPHLTDEGRRDLARQWERQRVGERKAPTLSRAELTARLAVSGIRLVVVKPEGKQ